MDRLERDAQNVKHLIPLLGVTRMERSLAYYLNCLGFKVRDQWLVEGSVRWCRLELGGAALMLQTLAKEKPPEGRLGEGVSLWFNCQDALQLYQTLKARGVAASEPEVGNAMWRTTVQDPDGYCLHFVSPTDVAEDTLLSQVS